MKAYKKYFDQALRLNYPGRAVDYIRETEFLYQGIRADLGFVSSSGNPMDRRLYISGYFLALIQVLDRDGKSMEEIRSLVTGIASEYVRPKNKWQAFLKRLPARLIKSGLASILLKKMDRMVSRNAHPEGFRVRVLTGKEETLGFGYGVDILECGICKLFARHGFSKYAALLCEVDYITSSLAGLKLIRTGTIANGAERCDFRFKRTGG